MIPLRSTEVPRSPAFVTGALILVNVALFLYELSLGPDRFDTFLSRYGVIPDRFEWLTLVTSMFLHGGWMHLIGNMWFLWIYGRNIEDLIGSAKFLFFYLVCGIAAGVIHVIVNRNSVVPTIGASGAIAGVMGAFLAKLPRARIITLVPIFIFITTMEIPAALLLVYWFIIQFFNGFGSISARGADHGIAWFAHIGGFIAGFLIVRAIPTRPRYLWT